MLLAGAALGTYLMRSTALWITDAPFEKRWLEYVPLGVLLAMSIGGVGGLALSPTLMVACAAATLVVVASTWLHLPLILRVFLGCLVFGLLR
jgi:branched-subunit amino acid transport protein